MRLFFVILDYADELTLTRRRNTKTFTSHARVSIHYNLHFLFVVKGFSLQHIPKLSLFIIYLNPQQIKQQLLFLGYEQNKDTVSHSSPYLRCFSGTEVGSS